VAGCFGAHVGVLGDWSQVERVLELTGGVGAEVVVDFVGENGSTAEGIAMTRQAGDYHVVGDGENVDVPTIDLVSSEKNVIGSLVGSYNDLQDMMALAASGAVTLHTQKYALDDFQQAITDLDSGNVRGRAILVP
jgi:NAD+-dependent secondary alcohol dehydrogenase Adh1